MWPLLTILESCKINQLWMTYYMVPRVHRTICLELGRESFGLRSLVLCFLPIVLRYLHSFCHIFIHFQVTVVINSLDVVYQSRLCTRKYAYLMIVFDLNVIILFSLVCFSRITVITLQPGISLVFVFLLDLT